MSDAGGAWTLHAPRPGSYVVVVRRLGYRPFTSGPIGVPVAGDSATVLRLDPLPTRLDTIEARAAAIKRSLDFLERVYGVLAHCPTSARLEVTRQVAALERAKWRAAQAEADVDRWVAVAATLTSEGVQRRALMPVDPERPPSLSTSLRLVLETCSAGASPNTTPVTKQIAKKNSRTVGSIEKTMKYGLPTSCVMESKIRMPA